MAKVDFAVTLASVDLCVAARRNAGAGAYCALVRRSFALLPPRTPGYADASRAISRFREVMKINRSGMAGNGSPLAGPYGGNSKPDCRVGSGFGGY